MRAARTGPVVDPSARDIHFRDFYRNAARGHCGVAQPKRLELALAWGFFTSDTRTPEDALTGFFGGAPFFAESSQEALHGQIYTYMPHGSSTRGKTLERGMSMHQTAMLGPVASWLLDDYRRCRRSPASDMTLKEACPAKRSRTKNASEAPKTKYAYGGRPQANQHEIHILNFRVWCL